LGLHWALSLIGCDEAKTIDALGRAEPLNYSNLQASSQNLYSGVGPHLYISADP
jgi:hypothetical protein